MLHRSLIPPRRPKRTWHEHIIYALRQQHDKPLDEAEFVKTLLGTFNIPCISMHENDLRNILKKAFKGYNTTSRGDVVVCTEMLEYNSCASFGDSEGALVQQMDTWA